MTRAAQLILLISGSFGTLLSGCSVREPKDIVTLVEVDTFKIQLDSVTSSVFHSMNIYEEDGVPYLAFQNYKRYWINIYNLETRDLVKKIEFQREGPNGIGSLDGFYIHTSDSIFTLSPYHYQIILSNGSGVVVKKYNLTNYKAGSSTALPRVSNVSPMILKNDTLYVAGVPDNYSPDKNVSKVYYNMIALNVKDGRSKYCNRMPDAYNEFWWGNTHVLFCYTYVNNSFLYSYAISDSIEIVTDYKKSRAYAGSKNFDKILPMKNLTHEFEENKNYLYSNPIYVGFIYDKYHKVYYRVAQQPLEEEYYGEALIGNLKRKESIIILDEKFSKIGEVDLPFDKYVTYEFFILKDGLCLPLKSKNSDDEKVFAIMQLKSKLN